MFAQFVLAMAIVGQCGGGFGGGFGGRVYSGGWVRAYSNGCGGYSQVYSDGCGGYSQGYFDDFGGCEPEGNSEEGCPIESSPLQVSTRLVGESVLCRYRNTGQVANKSYAKARVYDGDRVGLINVPIVNGFMPSCVFSKKNGTITSMICDYKDQIPYHGGMIAYGKKAEVKSELPATEVIRVPDAPVPSQETHPVPKVSEIDPPQSTPLPKN